MSPMNDNTTRPPSTLENPIVELRSTMIGLCYACPFDQASPKGCHFHQIRKRPMSERFAWVMHLDETTMQTLCEMHRCCLEEKETQPVLQEAICADHTH